MVSKRSVSLTVISIMEVPRRRPPSFTLTLPKPASSELASFGALQKVTKKDSVPQETDEATEKTESGEETFIPEAEQSDVFVEATAEKMEPVDTRSSLSSQDSFSEETIMSEERLAQEAEETKKKSEEEEAAAKARAAQRQLMSIEELVQSERNYLRLLQVSTVTIRSNLQKLQVLIKCWY